ncbi:MAG: hypothetical protein V5A46_08445 [Haloferacaceae archaeon]
MSRAEYALGLSGFLGLVVGLGIGLYQTILSDPMILGEQAVPRWLIGVHVHFIGLSLISLFYSSYIDGLFRGYRDLTAGGAILGQWGVPGFLFLVYVTGIGPFGALILLSAVSAVAVVVAFAVNFARRGPEQ